MALLPFDCTRDFLSGHKLVSLSQASPERVHECFKQLLEAHDARMSSASDSGAPTRRKGQIKCPVCPIDAQYYMQIDSQRGDAVCSRCGACTRVVVPENCETYEERPACIKTQAPNNIAEWAWKASRHDDDTARRFVEREMEHWNDYHSVGTHWGIDRLAWLKSLTKNVANASCTEKAIAALLFPYIAETYDAKRVEQDVRSGRPLTKVVLPQAPVKYACQRCGAAVDSLYAQKRHPCGWGSKKRRRP